MIELGHFYFIRDEYFQRFNDERLMQNKGEGHARPCFYAFLDRNTGLFWLIPVSSRVEKYKLIYNKRVNAGKRCDGIVFGEFMSKERVFLIQNMCPVTDDYIDKELVVMGNGQSVRISRELETILMIRARRILGLTRHGKNAIFPDVLKIEKELLMDR